MIWEWILRIALWTVAGYLGSKLMKDGSPNGLLGNVILGFVGGRAGRDSGFCGRLMLGDLDCAEVQPGPLV